MRALLRILVALSMLAASAGAHAVLTIKITRGIEGAQPIAIVPFGWRGGSAGPPVDIAAIVASDLARTGLFAPIPAADLPGRPDEASTINFTDWRLLGTANLVIGRVTPAAAGRYRVAFRLFEVFRARQLTGFEVEASARELRRTAHQISDIIYEQLTGEPGVFDTRIAYVTELRLASGRRYALSVADSDGLGASTVLESSQPIMSPAWAPDGGRLAYVSYEGERARIFVQDVTTGQRRAVSAFPGLNGAPAWSPDGRRLALTLSKDGNPEIYLLHVASGRLQRITASTAIDTEPAWAPDGQSLLFTSDRGGTPQLYRVPATGGTPRRLTFEGKYNARGRFSPDGERVAFVHGHDGAFSVAVLTLATGAFRILTDTRLDESPSFAPNGSMILYATTDAGGASLAAVSTDGRVRQRLAVQEGGVREPAWSPRRTR